MTLNFGQIPSLTTELAAIERWKINVLYYDHSGTFNFDWIFILAGNEDNHNILDGFEIRQDLTNGTTELDGLDHLKNRCILLRPL